MNKLKVLLLLLLSFSLNGCYYFFSDSFAFHDEGMQPLGTIYVQSKVAKVKYALEFEHYKEKLEAKLEEVGYTVVDNEKDADYKAILSYGIGKGSKIIYSGKFASYSTISGKLAKRHVMVLSLEIMKGEDRIYEGRVRNKSYCPVLAGVYDDMLKIMFKNFPGESGKVYQDEYKKFTSCGKY